MQADKPGCEYFNYKQIVIRLVNSQMLHTNTKLF